MAPACPTTRPASSSALSVLKILDELKFKDYARLTLMLNTNEETGSRGSRALIEKLAKEHDVTLNLEGGRARRRHHDLAQGLRHHHGRGQGPRLARRRRARAWPQRGDGAGASDAAARQARQSRARAPRSTSRWSRPATARTSFRTTRWRRPTSARWCRRSSTASSANCREGGEEQADPRHRGDDEPDPQLPDHAAERADRRAGRAWRSASMARSAGR